MDFKWTLSRPGISLEFETGSVKEAIGLLEQEGTQIQEVFGFSVGHSPAQVAEAPEAETTAEPAKKRGRPAKAAPEAVAPEPLPVPPVPNQEAPPLAPTPTPLPANELAPGANGVPAFLDASTRAPAAPAALPPPPSLPPVGTLGPKVVAALDERAKGSPDGGQALADWLAGHGLTLKGATFPDACRAVLMMRDDKLTAAAAQLGIS